MNLRVPIARSQLLTWCLVLDEEPSEELRDRSHSGKIGLITRAALVLVLFEHKMIT